jgi:peptidoglycan/LPS O-acetylase OafA/YrhL
VLWLTLIAAPTAVLMGQGDRVLASTLVSLFYIGDFAIAYDWVPIADAYVHIWSLAIEEQFYFVWPSVLVFLALRHPERLRTILWCLLGAAVGLQLAAHQSGSHAYFLPRGHIVAIATGCLSAGLCAHGVPDWMNRLVRSTTVAAAVILMIGAVCLWADQMPATASSMVLTVTSIGIGLLVMHAREVRSGFVIGLLTLNVMVWLGRRSYGLYLYHRTLAMLIPELLPGITLKVGGPLVLILAFLVAEASYRWVELPIMRAGRRRFAHREANAE